MNNSFAKFCQLHTPFICAVIKTKKNSRTKRVERRKRHRADVILFTDPTPHRQKCQVGKIAVLSEIPFGALPRPNEPAHFILLGLQGSLRIDVHLRDFFCITCHKQGKSSFNQRYAEM
jgi:hypothetical protein